MLFALGQWHDDHFLPGSATNIADPELRTQNPEWSLMSRKKLTLPLSSSGYTGYQ